MKILFKLLVSLFLVLTLTGCFTKGGVTGKQTWGQAMSPAWFGMAPKEDINYYFDKKSVSELCILWENYYPGSKGSVKIRSHISRSLERRGEDGLKCSNPSSDSKAIASKKLEDLENEMKCTARRTEWKSLCATGDYYSVNGRSCYGRWSNTLDC